MASLKQFRLPDVGEGLTEAEIVHWHVKVGDVVTQNQTIVDIETAKALVELPSPFAGVVSELLIPEGATVDVGTPIIIIDVAPASVPLADVAPAPLPEGESPAIDDLVPSIPAVSEMSAGRTANLVGYGPRADSPVRRRQRQVPVATSSRPTPSWPSVAASVAAPSLVSAEVAVMQDDDNVVSVLAKPPVRKLARDLGIDVQLLHGTGPDGTITRSDVEAAADSSRQAAPTRPLPRGGEERIAIRGVRKATAQAMVNSVQTVPHVTEFTTIDVTRSMRAVTRLRELPEFADVKVTPLLLVAKAILLGLERYPMVNSTWDEPNGEIVVKHYVNLGIAAATPRGLVVPNIKNAEALSLPQLARSINALAFTAREGRTSVADMQRGSFTITNVGVFGVDTGTPIINPGEAAILAFGAIRDQPWVHRGKVKSRSVTTLALSFDHRIIDGELGSRFLRDVAMFLEDPASSLLARL
ncbi:MAG TPA: dihydrolipoamide acetyltransferase family protein [Acidothermaceae bacterium]